jgi:hypothetical protein
MHDDFDKADHAIAALLAKLHRKGVCSCCAAQALLAHGTTLAQRALGHGSAIEMLEHVLADMRADLDPPPSRAIQVSH